MSCSNLIYVYVFESGVIVYVFVSLAVDNFVSYVATVVASAKLSFAKLNISALSLAYVVLLELYVNSIFSIPFSKAVVL